MAQMEFEKVQKIQESHRGLKADSIEKGSGFWQCTHQKWKEYFPTTPNKMEYTNQKCRDEGSFKKNLTNYLLFDGKVCHLRVQIHKK